MAVTYLVIPYAFHSWCALRPVRGLRLAVTASDAGYDYEYTEYYDADALQAPSGDGSRTPTSSRAGKLSSLSLAPVSTAPPVAVPETATAQEGAEYAHAHATSTV